MRKNRPQIVDPMRVVRVRMSDEDGVEPLHAHVDQLLAQIRPRVDKHGRHAVDALPLDERRATAAAVPWIVGIAGAPAFGDTRHAGRRAATEDGEPKAQGL